MKWNRIKGVAFVCCGALLLCVGCSNKYDLDKVLSQEDDSVEQLSKICGTCGEEIVRVKQLIASLGYDTTIVNDEGEYYLVEDKYRFCKEVVRELLAQGYNPINTRMYSSGNDTLAVHFRKINISSVIDSWGCNGSNYVSDAIGNWNAVESDLRFNPEIGNDHSDDFPVNISVQFDRSSGKLVQLWVDMNSKSPVKNVVINTSNYLWTIIENNGKGSELLTHALGEAIGLKKIEPSGVDDYMRENGGDVSIMFSPEVAGLGNHWDVNIWSMGISSNDTQQLCEMYPVTTIPDLTLSWNKEHGEEDDKYLLVNKYYTLSFNSAIGCCEGLSKTVTIYKEDGSFVSTRTTNGDSLELRFEKEGKYTVEFGVDDVSLAIPIHKQTLQVNVRSGFDWDDVEQVELFRPYKLRYYYDKTKYISHTSISWSAKETIFGVDGGNDFIFTTEADSCEITLNKNGCYFIQGIIKRGAMPIDTVYCNITKMDKLPDGISIQKIGGENSGYTPYTSSYYTNTREILASYEYEMTIHSNVTMSGRLGCLVESEYENRSWAIDDGIGVDSRKLNRCWLMRLNPVSWDNVYSTTEVPLRTLYWKNFTEEEQANGSPIWRYEYYTGCVYCPQNGIREVKSMKLHELPLTRLSVAMNETVARMGFEYE